jgi:hypothetical protein
MGAQRAFSFTNHPLLPSQTLVGLENWYDVTKDGVIDTVYNNESDKQYDLTTQLYGQTAADFQIQVIGKNN